MPAIVLDRIHQQIQSLSEIVTNPPVFIAELHNYFEFYANRVQRIGMSGKHYLKRHYNVPKPILKYLVTGIKIETLLDPLDAINLCKDIWNEDWIEFRLVAISFLGKIDPIYLEEIISVAEEWVQAENENEIIRNLSLNGFKAIRKVDIHSILTQIKKWLSSEQYPIKHFGLIVLADSIPMLSSDYLPNVYNYIQPLLSTHSTQLRPEITKIIRGLAEISPKETAYLLRQAIENSPTKDLIRLINESATQFPNEIRISLTALAQRKRQEMNI